MPISVEERSMFADAYNFFAKYKGVGKDPEKWDEIVEESKKILAHHNDEKMMEELLFAVIDRLDEQAMGGGTA